MLKLLDLVACLLHKLLCLLRDLRFAFVVLGNQIGWHRAFDALGDTLRSRPIHRLDHFVSGNIHQLWPRLPDLDHGVERLFAKRRVRRSCLHDDIVLTDRYVIDDFLSDGELSVWLFDNLPLWLIDLLESRFFVLSNRADHARPGIHATHS